MISYTTQISPLPNLTDSNKKENEQNKSEVVEGVGSISRNKEGAGFCKAKHEIKLSKNKTQLSLY